MGDSANMNNMNGMCYPQSSNFTLCYGWLISINDLPIKKKEFKMVIVYSYAKLPEGTK